MKTLLTIEQTADFLKQNDDFLLITHKHPDGDTLGSAAALCLILRELGKTAYLLKNSTLTEKYLSYIGGCFAPEGFSPAFVVAVDIASPSLFTSDSAEYALRTDLCIDHHISNELYAKNTLLDTTAAACGEIVLSLSHLLGTKLTTEAAELLFISITTDTGCFRYSNTTPATLRAAAELLEYGFDAHAFIYAFFELKTRSRFALEQSIMENAEFFFDGQAAFSCLSLQIITDTGANDDDLDNISGLLRTIEGVKAGLLFRQKSENLWKLSMRSAPGINASSVCAKLGGGGHPAAAGATLTGSYDEVKQQVLDALSIAFESRGS